MRTSGSRPYWILAAAVPIVIVVLAASSVARTIALQSTVPQAQTIVSAPQVPQASAQTPKPLTLNEAIATARTAIGDPVRAVVAAESLPRTGEIGADGRARSWRVTVASLVDGHQMIAEVVDGSVSQITDALTATPVAIPDGIDSDLAIRMALARGQLTPGSGKSLGYRFGLRLDGGGHFVVSVSGTYSAWPARVEIDRISGIPVSRDIFAPSNQGGVAFSQDGGKTWTASPLRGLIFGLVTFNGTAYAIRESPQGLTLWSSSDGAAWREMGSLPLQAGMNGYTILPTASGEIFVGTENGIWRSGDQGRSWLQEPSPSGPAQYLAQTASHRYAAVVAGPEVGLFASQSGSPWSKLPMRAGIRLSALADNLVAATDETQTTATILTDGASFELQTPAHTLRLARSASAWFADSGGSGIYRSGDGGRSWNLVLPAPTASVIATPGGIILAGGFRSGFFASVDDGRTWEATSSPASLIQGSNEIYGLTVLGNTVLAVNGGTMTWQPY